METLREVFQFIIITVPDQRWENLSLKLWEAMLVKPFMILILVKILSRALLVHFEAILRVIKSLSSFLHSIHLYQSNY